MEWMDEKGEGHPLDLTFYKEENEYNIENSGSNPMSISVLPRFVTKRIAAWAIGFLLIEDFNVILVRRALLLLCTVFETACRTIVIARRSMYPDQRDMIMCVH